MKTITLHTCQFVVRETTVETIKAMKDSGFKNIQELLVEFFTEVNDVLTDEYALLLAVYFKDSKAYDPKTRQARCAADVRKYNQALFKCQEEVLPIAVKHLDGGSRTSKRDLKAEADALSALD